MSNYSSLKATINANVKTNGNQEITGQVMNAVLNAMVNSLGSGYQYMGIATPTNPGTNQTPDDRCFYIATTPGTYSHLGGLVVNDGEVAILKYDSAWSKEVTGAATAAQVTQLGRDVEDNTDNINALQAEIDAIQPIVIEGNVTNAPDEEDITTDENDLLKFKDRTQAVNQMGYVILRKNKTFASQVTATNTIYEIRYPFDLGGASVTIPAGCVLKFVGGQLRNGTIVFNGTKLQNAIFNSCSFSGDIVADRIDDTAFTAGIIDDSSVLAWMITQAANNNAPLYLNKDYTISGWSNTGESYVKKAFVRLVNKSLTIYGKGHTIYDGNVYITNNTTPFIELVECHDIRVENLYYEGLHNDANNKTNYDTLGTFHSGGVCVFWAFGDTNNVKIVDGKLKYGHSYFMFGCTPQVAVDADDRANGLDNLVVDGLTNAFIQVNAFDVTYGVAVNKGKNLDIDVNFNYASRGVALYGVTRSKVSVVGCHVTTPIMCLLKDAISYTDHTYTERVYSCCDEIDANVRWLDYQDSLTTYTWGDCLAKVENYSLAESLSTADQFANRETPYIGNIRLNLFGRPTNGYSLAAAAGAYDQNSAIADNYVITLSGNSARIFSNGYKGLVSTRLICVNFKCAGYYGGNWENISFFLIRSSLESIDNTGAAIPIIYRDSESSVGFASSANKRKVLISDCDNGYHVISEITENLPARSIYVMSQAVSMGYSQFWPILSSIVPGESKEIIFANFSGSNLSIYLDGGVGNTTSIIVYPSSFVRLILFTNGTNYYRMFERIDSRGFLGSTSANLGIGKIYDINVNTSYNKLVWSNGTRRMDANGFTPANKSGDTASRPSLISSDVGFPYFDTTLGKMIVWNGSAWVNMDGSALSYNPN